MDIVKHLFKPNIPFKIHVYGWVCPIVLSNCLWAPRTKHRLLRPSSFGQCVPKWFSSRSRVPSVIQPCVIRHRVYVRTHRHLLYRPPVNVRFPLISSFRPTYSSRLFPHTTFLIPSYTRIYKIYRHPFLIGPNLATARGSVRRGPDIARSVSY